MIVALEAALAGTAGACLAWRTAVLALMLVGFSSGSGAGPGIAVAAALVGGLNGLISGGTGSYDWRRLDGWLAFTTAASASASTPSLRGRSSPASGAAAGACSGMRTCTFGRTGSSVPSTR
jgi:hypothetical protein